MFRLETSILLLAACADPAGTGGGTQQVTALIAPGGSTSPAASGVPTGTTASTTATTVVPVAPAAGPWTDFGEPSITIVGADQQDLTSATGDFDGDGQEDIVVGSSVLLPGTLDVWFGPLAPGEYTIGTSTTRILGTDVHQTVLQLTNAGDVENDGRDALLVDGYLIRVPARGVVADMSVDPIAGNGTQARLNIAFGDIDGDGWRDALVDGALFVRIVYGPLHGTTIGSDAYDGDLVPADEGWLRWDNITCTSWSIDILPDVSGDGQVEVRAGGHYWYWDEDTHCDGRNPHAVWSPGDIRGRSLGIDEAVVANLPMSAFQIGDIDGDGIGELVEVDYGGAPGSSIYSLGEAIRTGVVPAPLSTATDATFTDWHIADLDGDSRQDVLAHWDDSTYLFVSSESVLAGPTFQAAAVGTLWDTSINQLEEVELTGDGVSDFLAGSYLRPVSTVRLYDGSNRNP